MGSDKLIELKEAIEGLQRARAIELTEATLAAGTVPMDVVEQALRPAMQTVGDQFEQGKMFLPELVQVGKIAAEMGGLLEKAMASSGGHAARWSVAIGTVKGDVHVIGKNIVAVMLRAHGFDVRDLGSDVSSEEFLAAAEEVDAIGMSALLTTVTRNIRDIVTAVSAAHPDKVIIAGGAAMNPGLADALGVLYGPDAASGVKLLVETLGHPQPARTQAR